MKLPKPFTAWMLYDANNVYEPTLHWKRNSAEADKRHNAHILDAKSLRSRECIRSSAYAEEWEAA